MINILAGQLLGVGREKEGQGAKVKGRDVGGQASGGAYNCQRHTPPNQKDLPNDTRKKKKNCRSNLNVKRVNGDGISDFRTSDRKIHTSILRVRRIPVGHDLRTGQPSALQSGQFPPTLEVPADVSEALSPHLCQICVDS